MGDLLIAKAAPPGWSCSEREPPRDIARQGNERTGDQPEKQLIAEPNDSAGALNRALLSRALLTGDAGA